MRGQLEAVGLVGTPNPEPYMGADQTNKTFLALKEEVTPEAGDKYLQESILLSFSITFGWGKVV